MTSLEDTINTQDGETFTEALQRNHLSQVIASKYERDPLSLGEHYSINFTPAPAEFAESTDPAEESVVLLLGHRPDYKSAVMGNLLIPDNMDGKHTLKTWNIPLVRI